MDYSPATGLHPDLPDVRDFQYKDVLGMGAVVPSFDWNKGYNAYEDLKLPIIIQDQGSSSSCTCQATKAYVRRWLFKLTGQDIEHSAHDSYCKVFLPQGGAYIRDAVKNAATDGNGRESVCPSYDNGQPPSEAFMRTVVSDPQAKTFDKFTYRVIPGQTNDIEIFALAISNNLGVLGGFTGSNNGWCRPDIKAPAETDNHWGHCVDLCAAGKLDIDVGDLKAGTKCVFTANSWGNRYTIASGRWKGLQAIPEDYFLASTPQGNVPGAFVYPSWVLVPDTQLPINQKIMDAIKKLEGKTVLNVGGHGELAKVVGGKKLIISKDRAPAFIAKEVATGVAADIWDAMPSDQY